MMFSLLLCVAIQLQFINPITADCFGGKYVQFEAGGKQYLAGWNALGDVKGAESRCKSIGATLADINTDDQLAAISKTLGALDTKGARSNGNPARFWLQGKTTVKQNGRVQGSDTGDKGTMCKSLSDWQRCTHKADPFRIYSKPCNQKRYFLCELPVIKGCSDGKTVRFEVDGRHYLASWEKTVNQAGGEQKCKALGATLADLNSDAKILAVGNTLGGLDTTGAQLTSEKVARFWLAGRTNVGEHGRIAGSNAQGVPNGARCKSTTDWERTKHPADPFRVYSKKCNELRHILCESDAPICEHKCQ